MLSLRVSPANITTISVPGAYELPLTCLSTIRAAAATAATASAATAQKETSAGQKMRNLDLIGASVKDLGDPRQADVVPGEITSEPAAGKGAFDAVIAVGVLIKGETMHFEYIAEAVSQGLMRVQLDTGTPVIFGVLTLLSHAQGEARAGLFKG